MKPLGYIVVLLIACYPADAAVRHFSLGTTERLGRELYEQTRHPQTLNEPQQRAKRAAMDALRNLDKSYRFMVLSNPDGDGYLVYALATSSNPADIVLGVHYRVSVSPDGNVKQVEPLGLNRGVVPGNGSALPVGTHQAAFWCTCLVSTQPLETHVYLSLLHGQPCVVGTSDRAIWCIENGKITKQQKKK